LTTPPGWFIIRLKADRNVIYRSHPVIASQLSSSTRMLYAETIVREESGGEKPQTIEFGFRRVRFPGRKQQLFLVVVKGFAGIPAVAGLMLLTNLDVKPTRKSLFFVVEAYPAIGGTGRLRRPRPGRGSKSRPTE